MAKNKLIDADAVPNTKVLAGGAIYDMNRGRIVANPGGGKYAITSDNARDMVKRRVELKREAVARAANRVVQDKSLIAEFGDLAYIAEATQTMQLMATTPEAGKAAVMAYESLIKHSGMGEGKDADTAADPLSAVADVLRSVAEFARALSEPVIPMRNDHVIDADIQEEQ